MKKSLLSLSCVGFALLAFTSPNIYASNATATPANPSPLGLQIRPNLIGLWALKQPNMQCTEYYNFQENEKLVVNSGKEWVLANYTYEYPAYHQESLPIMYLTMLYDNTEEDCAGSRQDQSNEESSHYIKWNTPHEFELCAKADGTNCWVKLNRILP